MMAPGGVEMDTKRSRRVAIFMAFGTKGDVYPIAAVAAAFSRDQTHYCIFFITHSAHKNISSHLAEKGITCLPISSPPVLSGQVNDVGTGSLQLEFLQQKMMITKQHRRECLSAVERILGNGPNMEGDFIAINFFALEGWSLAELFHVRCVVAAPYVVPYSAPSSFEQQFRKEHPVLYHYLQEAPMGKVCWKDVMHWMWPLFSDHWGSWRSEELNLSACPLTDPVTGLPTWHDWPPSPLLLYGFSKDIVECPDYWSSNFHVCGFWFVPIEWQFSCKKCGEISALHSSRSLMKINLCSAHAELQYFLETPASMRPIFIGLSSIGSMGFLRSAQAFLKVLQSVLEVTDHRFIVFTAGYEPLEAAIWDIATKESLFSNGKQLLECGVSVSNGRLFCFSGTVPYTWLFKRCAVAIHHGGSGSTAAALCSGIPQIICPFMLDQFYWAEKMNWLGLAPPPLRRNHLVPDSISDSSIRVAGSAVSEAIKDALSPEVKARAEAAAKSICHEDGLLEAVKLLKKTCCSSQDRCPKMYVKVSELQGSNPC